MGRTSGILIVATVLVGVLFLVSGEMSNLTGSADSAHKKEIVVPAGQPANEKAAIEELVQHFYDTLRRKDYQEAVAFYEKDAFKGTGMNPAKAIEAASQLTGVPRSVKLEALRIDGNTATGELLIDRKGIGAVSYVARDGSGKMMGTWARTLHFVKQKGEWKIAKDSQQSVDELDAAAKKLLKSLKNTQKSRKEKADPARTAAHGNP
jgi:ketosteroid isomerase-like protein